MKYKALRDTILKASAVDSAKLTKSDTWSIAANTVIECYNTIPVAGQHTQLVFKQPFAGRLAWFVYDPHWEKPQSAIALAVAKFVPKKTAKLSVPYFNQRDNWEMIQEVPEFGYPDRTCCTTSNAMLVAFCLGGTEVNRLKSVHGVDQFESYYATIVAKYGDSTDHNAQTQALQEFGIESYWTTTGSPKDVTASLSMGFPVVGGFLYKGSGHICLLVGFTADGFYVHDPFGARAGSTDSYAIRNDDDGISNHGEYDFYSNSVVGELLWETAAPRSENPESGWCRFVTSVKGKSTGVPKGL